MTPSPFFRHAPDQQEYFFREGCHITEWLNHPDDPDASIARARVEPGITTRWHALDGITERYVILEGRGRAEIGDLSEELSAGDVAVIPAGVRQRITNIGDDDLVFLAICTPRFEESAYRDLE